MNAKEMPGLVDDTRTGGTNGAAGGVCKVKYSTNRPATQALTAKPQQIRSVVMPLFVPDELAKQDRFVCWRYGLRDGKVTKIPVNPRTGWNAATDAPSTWATLDAAKGYYDRKPREVSGIGFNQRGTDIVGNDFDHCVDDNGNIDAWAWRWVQRFNTYTEYSPSGHGIRMFGKGRKPGKREKRGDVELYDGESTRYLTFTGNHVVGTPLDVNDVTQPLAELYAEMFGAADDAAPTPPTPAQPVNLDDIELLSRASAARNGGRFLALWRGDTSAHTSASEADFALVGALLFWTGGDAARVDRLFRASGLMRDKWDRRTGERTYGALTIAHCASGQTQFYTPPQTRPANVTAAGEVLDALPSVQDLWRILHAHIKHDGPRCKDCGGQVPYEHETATTVSGGVRCFRCKRRDCLDWQVYRAKQLTVQSDIHTWSAHYATKLPVDDYNRMVDRGLLRDIAQWFAVLEQDDVMLVASSEALSSLSIATRLDALAPMMAAAWLSRKPGSRLRDPKKAARAKRQAIASETPKPAPVVATVDDDPVIAQRKAAFGLIDLDPVDVHTLLDIIQAAGGDVDHKRRKWEYPVQLKAIVRERVSQWADVAGLAGRMEIDTFPNQSTEKVSISSPPACEQPSWPNMTPGQQRYARLLAHKEANDASLEREVYRM